MATVRGRYSLLSRGKHCAKHMPSGKWASRDANGDLVLDEPGQWMLSTTDGFSRKKTIYVVVDDDGEIMGYMGGAFSWV